jgi:hypothetical protein
MKVRELTADLSFSWQNILQQLTTSPPKPCIAGLLQQDCTPVHPDFEFVHLVPC